MMKRVLPFISVGQILDELLAETGRTLSRPTFLRKSKELSLPEGTRTAKNWRMYSRIEANAIKTLLKEHYRWTELKKREPHIK